MIFFGHVGLTLGAAWGLHNAVAVKEGTPAESPDSSTRTDVSPAGKVLSLMRRLDYRLVLAASMLPDAIDKPLGLLLRTNGRTYAHTLLFIILLAAGGFFLYRTRRRTWLVALSMGVLTHIVFDQMWRAPRTLLWPLFGFSFPRGDVTALVPPFLRALLTGAPWLNAWDIHSWISDAVQAMLADPRDYIPELLGLAVLLFFAYVLIRGKQVRRFLGTGRVPVMRRNNS
jgi:inner membrane protein